VQDLGRWWESHSRAVGIAGIAGITCNRPDNCSNGCFVGSVGDGLIALVVMKRRCIRVDVPGVLGV
jgi:hypothetical protein